MRRILIIMLLSVFTLSTQSFAGLREWEDNQVTGVNRLDGRSTFWYYPSFETAINGGYYNCPTNKSLNGKWKFSFANKVEDRVEDFYKTSYDVSAWDEIQVPGSWPFQGYDRPVYLNHPYEFALKNPYPAKLPEDWSPVGSYRRNFTVPADWKNQRVVLHFGAVKSSFYVWVNGVKVGYSQDSKMQAEFDITPYIKEGENTLAVEVYRFSIGSYIECQDFWRLAGIKRDVWIYATPKSYIKDFAVKAGLENDYADGVLTVDVDLATIAASKKQNIELQLIDAEGKVVYSATKTEKATTKKDGKLTFTANVAKVNKWSGEKPYLYTLVISSEVDGVKNYVSSKVGFRTVELRNSQLQLNGKPIYVRGVNRHEHHPELGHYVPKETVEKDVELMKKLNINSVRTCHYPADPYFYELCDRYGLYVCDEANIESHGLGAALQAPYDFGKHIADDQSWSKIHHDRMERMFQRDKNHPSVIVWSMGNECGDGVVFRSGYEMLKNLDPTRLVQFEQAGTQSHTDVYCPMYMRMDKVKNYATSNDAYRPLILCEYVHAMGNSLGNFQDYWDLFEEYPLLQGGFIWDWVDQSVVDYRDGVRFLDYGGAFGYQEQRNDHAFCMNGLINGDREYNPHAYEAKKVLQGIRVKAVGTSINEFEFVNNLSFTCLSHYAQSWKIEKDGRVVESGVMNVKVKPLSSARVAIDYKTEIKADADYYITFEFKTKNEENLLPKGYQVAYDQLALNEKREFDYTPKSVVGSLNVVEDSKSIKVSNDGFVAVFCKESGALAALELDGFSYMEAALRPDFWRVKIDNDGWFQDGKYWKEAHKRVAVKDVEIKYNKDKKAIKSVEITFKNLIDLDPKDETSDLSQTWFNTTYTVYPNAEVKVENHFLPVYYHAERDMSMPRLGQLFKLNGDLKEAEWFGRGPWENYADRKTSALVSRYEMAVSDMPYEYTRPQENGYRTDVREITLSSKGGNTIQIVGLPRICINAQNASKESYEVDGKPIRNTIDLKKENSLYLNVDFSQMGVGGDNSWGNPVHVDYRVLMRDYRYGYVIKLGKSL